MSKIKLLLIVFVLLTSGQAGRAQSTAISVSTKATTEDIQSWLVSSDPRLIAWGAYFARERDDPDELRLMARIVDRWTPPQDNQSLEGRAQIDAMSDILDALIQRNTNISPDSVSKIVSSFPSQAVILAARLPPSESTPLFLSWYAERGVVEPQKDFLEIIKNPPTDEQIQDLLAVRRRNFLAAIAAMMLAKTPPAGFAASILSESEDQIDLSVVSDNAVPGGGVSATCGDGFGTPSPRGWPSVFSYGIAETYSQPHEPILIEAPGEWITYSRHDKSLGWGSCSPQIELSPDKEHRLLAEMLGVSEKEMAWKTRQNIGIHWESNSQFQHELDSLVASEEVKLRATVEAARVKNLLTAEEAVVARPKLIVSIIDCRRPAEPPLPQLLSNDPSIVFNAKSQCWISE